MKYLLEEARQLQEANKKDLLKDKNLIEDMIDNLNVMSSSLNSLHYNYGQGLGKLRNSLLGAITAANNVDDDILDELRGNLD